MIEAPLVGLEWCTNHLLKNHETISQIDYNYIFRGNKLGYAPNRFSYPFLRTVILIFDTNKTAFVHRTKAVFLYSDIIYDRIDTKMVIDKCFLSSRKSRLRPYLKLILPNYQ